MSMLLDKLPDDPAELKQIIRQQQAERVELQNEYDAEVSLLREQIRVLLHRNFGRSSEAAPGQNNIGDTHQN